jgi:acyl-CoA synthetase (AMP-forming)/AMP-acid ligase II
MAAATTTINAMFQESTARWADKVALKHKVEGHYRDIPYRELARQVEQMASGLADLGIEKGDRVALLSENRPEWAVTDLAVLALGAINVPLYTTLPAPQIAYILRNSGARAIVVSDAKQLQKTLAARADAPALAHVIAMDAPAAGRRPDGPRLRGGDGSGRREAARRGRVRPAVAGRGARTTSPRSCTRRGPPVTPRARSSRTRTSSATSTPRSGTSPSPATGSTRRTRSCRSCRCATCTSGRPVITFPCGWGRRSGTPKASSRSRTT